jgi:hypothetical protein
VANHPDGYWVELTYDGEHLVSVVMPLEALKANMEATEANAKSAISTLRRELLGGEYNNAAFTLNRLERIRKDLESLRGAIADLAYLED